MARPTMPREELLERLSTVFRTHGYDGASLALLSEATGLVKASLYYQFPRGKLDMAEAVLAWLSQKMTTGALAQLNGPGTPRERIVRSVAEMSRFYGGGTLSCAINVFSIGEAGPLFRAHLARSVETLGQAFGSVLQEAGLDAGTARRRAEDALIVLQGALVVSHATVTTGVFERVIEELPDRLLQGAPRDAQVSA